MAIEYHSNLSQTEEINTLLRDWQNQLDNQKLGSLIDTKIKALASSKFAEIVNSLKDVFVSAIAQNRVEEARQIHGYMPKGTLTEIDQIVGLSPLEEALLLANEEACNYIYSTFDKVKLKDILLETAPQRWVDAASDKKRAQVLDKIDKSHFTPLHLYNLNLTSLPRFLLLGLNNVTHIDLSQNRLTSFPMPELPALKILNISQNRLTSFNSGNAQLSELDLSGNRLASVTIAKGEDLVLLNLEKNPLIELPVGLEKCFRLESLLLPESLSQKGRQKIKELRLELYTRLIPNTHFDLNTIPYGTTHHEKLIILFVHALAQRQLGDARNIKNFMGKEFEGILKDNKEFFNEQATKANKEMVLLYISSVGLELDSQLKENLTDLWLIGSNGDRQIALLRIADCSTTIDLRGLNLGHLPGFLTEDLPESTQIILQNEPNTRKSWFALLRSKWG